ncbi:MAG: PD-(D/E)XK nuclease family protein [Bacteroidales bacterium]
MRILFDPDFEHGYWPGPLRDAAASAGEAWVGPSHFAQILETALGLAGPTLSMRERAARLVPATRSTEGFWSRSAAVDPFATARRLLQWRDTLIMGGWRGKGRARTLAELARVMSGCAPGLPDRLLAINAALPRRSAGIECVRLLAPRADLEPLWRCTLQLLEHVGVRVTESQLAAPATREGTDLAGARATPFHPRGDGSLRLLRPAGPLAAAEEVAAWLARTRPGAESQTPGGDVLIVGTDPALDLALHRHGLPTSGAAYEQRDAAALQVLPLVVDLGWTPQDPQRAYELLSLPSGPVPGDVASSLRSALAKWPAVDSDKWQAALAEGLDKIAAVERRERVKRRLDVLWDGRVARSGSYPAAEVVRRATMVRTWLAGRTAVADTDAPTWRVAVSQCDALLDLVQHSGLAGFTAAQLRHLVVEATESGSAETRFQPEAGIHTVETPGGVAGPARTVVWWTFNAGTSSRIERLPLTTGERAELESLGVSLADPARIAASQARRWRRPLDQAWETLLLVCPERDVAGEELHAHPLWDEIVARVPEKNARRYAERALLETSMSDVVPRTARTRLALPSPRRDWVVPPGRVKPLDQESPTSVQRLLECPFRWLLQYGARLSAPESAQVDGGTSPRLLGDLLHAIMNQLFAGPHRAPDEAAVEAGLIFDREGPRLVAALFLPGTDAQRERVRRAAVRTARTLYGLMAEGRLSVLATEASHTGAAFGTMLGGRIDLVLGAPPRILDLKWSGAGRKRSALKEGTAVQLAAYSFLQRAEDGTFPPVGYFVMDAQRLLTTDAAAFPGAEMVDGPSPQETWTVLETTHDVAWRSVAAGQVAAPGATEKDARPKDACIGEDGLLVMPSDCSLCDYTTLCGLAFKVEA